MNTAPYNKKGFGLVGLLIILGLVLAGGGAYLYVQNRPALLSPNSETATSTKDTTRHVSSGPVTGCTLECQQGYHWSTSNPCTASCIPDTPETPNSNSKATPVVAVSTSTNARVGGNVILVNDHSYFSQPHAISAGDTVVIFPNTSSMITLKLLSVSGSFATFKFTKSATSSTQTIQNGQRMYFAPDGYCNVVSYNLDLLSETDTNVTFILYFLPRECMP